MKYEMTEIEKLQSELVELAFELNKKRNQLTKIAEKLGMALWDQIKKDIREGKT